MHVLKRISIRLLGAAASLLLGTAIVAQTTGRIEGRIVDTTGSVMPGVTVAATSPSLQGVRSVVTDADGRFRMPGLPPGNYKVTAELAGFSAAELAGVRVSLDATAPVEFTLRPAEVAEVLTVTAEAPAIDPTSTTTGANFNEELFKTLPVTRTFQGLALAAPGVVNSGLGTNPSIGGASAAENRYVLDGLDTTDAAFGTVGSALPFEFIQEVEVKTGGYQAEYGGALGGVVNVLTKSGSNEFRGDVFGYYSSDALGSSSPLTATIGQDLGIDKEYDFGVGIGGPLVKDKLWFFAAANPTFTDRRFLTRQEKGIVRQNHRVLFSGKLNYQFDPNHRLVASAFGDPGSIEREPVLDSAGTVADNSDLKNYNYGLSYNGILSPTAFVEISAGRSDQNFKQTPLQDIPYYRDGSTGRRFASAQNCGDNSLIAGRAGRPIFSIGCEGGTFVQENGDSSRDELRGALSWYVKTGTLSHQLKLGGSFRNVKYADIAHYPGAFPGPLTDATGFVVDAQGLVGHRFTLGNNTHSITEYDQNSRGQTKEYAIFAQDQVQVGDRLTLNLGLRLDKSRSTGDRSAEFPERQLDFSFGDMVAPRLGFTLDVAGNGKSKLYGHFGKFYESIPLDINARAFGREQFNFYYFYYPEDGSLPTAANPGTWYYTYQLGASTGVKEGIKPMYTREAVAGFEYEVARNLSLGIKGVYRDVNDVIEDISVDNASTYFITNPGGVFDVNPVTGEPLAEPIAFPRAERKYRALELLIRRGFSGNWQFNGTYVLAKNEGNYPGLFRQDNGQLDPNITSLFDLPDLLDGAYGLLPNDRKHQFKAYGSYRWNVGLITGLYAQWLTGAPISKLGAHSLYGRRERFITPRGSEGRTDPLWNVDFHLEYPVRVGERATLNLIADLFNVFNTHAPLSVDQEWTTRRATSTTDPTECGGADPACATGNPSFGEPLLFQEPFRARLGVKLSW